jgi:DNA-binding NarL/FixJ family response regulator
MIGAALSNHGSVDLIAPDQSFDADQYSLLIVHATSPEALAVLDDKAESVASLVVGPVDDRLLIDSVERGALGFVDEGASLGEIAEAALGVANGSGIIPPNLLGALLRHVVERRRRQTLQSRRLEVLTGREREVFILAAMGWGRGEIAQKLGISRETSRTHLQNLMGKLDLHSQAELVGLAAECGMATSADRSS